LLSCAGAGRASSLFAVPGTERCGGGRDLGQGYVPAGPHEAHGDPDGTGAR